MSDYPKWICAPCGEKHGNRKPGIATWHTGKCDVCGESASVTEPRDYGHIPWPLKRAEILSKTSYSMGGVNVSFTVGRIK